MAICQCCRRRPSTRTLFKNGKPLKLCDFCTTQKPPAKAKTRKPMNPDPMRPDSEDADEAD